MGRTSEATRLHFGLGLLKTGYEEIGNSRVPGIADAVVDVRDVLRVSISKES